MSPDQSTSKAAARATRVSDAYDPQSVWAVNPKAWLRNDKKYVIAVFPTEAAATVNRLNPIEAAAITVFDGKRKCREVADICSAMAVESSNDRFGDAEVLVDRLLAKFRIPQGSALDPLLIPTETLTAAEAESIRTYPTPDFIVRPQDFNPTDMKLAFPASILWLLTNDCQVSCQYCYMHKPAVSKKELLPFARLKELMHEAKTEGVVGLYPSGGDILCYPHFFEFMELLDDLDFPPIVIPTKAFVSLDTAKRLAALKKMDNLQFSIDSTVPEIADFLVQSPGFHDRIVASIRNAQKAGIAKVTVKTVITPYNLPTITKLYRDMKQLGVSKITLATYCRSGYHHKEKLFNHADDYEWLDAELDRLRKEYPDDKITYQNGPPILTASPQQSREEAWKKRSACTAGRDVMTVCANGKVVACEQMPERDGDYIGDLRVQSISEVWFGREMDEYLFHPPKSKLKGTPCYDCEEYDECQTLKGLCVRNSCIFYGTRWTPTPNCPKVPAEQFVRER